MEANFLNNKGAAYELISQELNKILSDKEYKPGNVGTWIGKISENVLKGLKGLNINFKYIVNCIVSEKGGISIYSESYYSPHDLTLLVKWENDCLQAFVNVFVVSL